MANPAKTDSTRVLRFLPIVVGAIAGSLLVLNRVFTELLTPSQARSDVMGVIISAVLILVGIIWQKIQPVPPEKVDLEGEEGFELAADLPEDLQMELAWASHILLGNTVTRCLVVYYQGRVLLRRGILPEKTTVTPGPIVEKVLAKQKPIYLVTLKLYPGRTEFDYFPENVQGIICQPLGTQGVMILGADRPRSYTKQDENWVAAIAEKLTHSLERSPLVATPPADS